MSCKPASFLLFMLLCATASTQAQLIKNSMILHDGYEDNKLVRNHTVVHYYHSSKKLVAGFITLHQIVEFAHNDNFNAFSTTVQKDTILYFHGIIEKGKRNGTFLDLSEGYVFYVYSFENDKQHGEYTGYYNNGQLYCKGTYKQGKQTGKYRQYYANGKPSLYKNFSEGVSALLYEEYYYQNGQIESKGSFYNGKKVNEWEYYNYQGNLLRTEYFNKGRLARTRTY